MVCNKCGKTIAQDSEFCEYCGAKIEKEVEASSKKNFYFLIIGALLVIIIILLVSFLWINQGKEDFEKTKKSIIHQGIASSVVSITCPFADSDLSLDSEGYSGSGTIISDDGFIVTNAHIIPVNEEGLLDIPDEGCLVMLPDPTTGELIEAYWAEPTVYEELSDEYDIAFLEIYDIVEDEDGEIYGEYPRVFPVYDEPDECSEGEEYFELGDPVRIFGYPSANYGWSLTITEGIISGFPGDGLVLTSAKIDAGNSGGLAVDDEGCMVGIPTAVSFGEYDNLGVIISSELLTEFVDKINEDVIDDTTFEIKYLYNDEWISTGISVYDIENVEIVNDDDSYNVSIKLNSYGKNIFKKTTTDNIGNQIGLFIDDTIISAPTIREIITNGELVITGTFTYEEATNLKNRLKE